MNVKAPGMRTLVASLVAGAYASLGCSGGDFSGSGTGAETSPPATVEDAGSSAPGVDAAPSSPTLLNVTAPFLAFPSNFQPFTSWPSFHYATGTPVGGVHTAGPRTEFINALPPAGATTFPVGTIIVKRLETGDPTADQRIFAMVKRGGDFNAGGAVDWEWYELQYIGDKLAVVWHGFGPPAGEQYGGDPTANCNSCHVAARENDYVQSPSIRLSASMPSTTDAGR